MRSLSGYLDGADAIGRRIQTRAGSFAIVGVARNSVYDAFGEPAQPAVYFSYRDIPASQGEIHLRTRSGRETTLASETRAVLRDLDPMLPLYDVRTFSQHLERNLFSSPDSRAHVRRARATPARPCGDGNLRCSFVRRVQTNERDWRAAGVRGH